MLRFPSSLGAISDLSKSFFNSLFEPKKKHIKRLPLTAAQEDEILLDLFSKNKKIEKYYGFAPNNSEELVELKLEEKKSEQVSSPLQNKDENIIKTKEKNEDDDFDLIEDDEINKIDQQQKNEPKNKFHDIHQNGECYIVKNKNNQEIAVSFTVQDNSNANSPVKEVPPMKRALTAHKLLLKEHKNIPLVMPLVETGSYGSHARNHFVTAFIDPGKKEVTILDSRPWWISFLYNQFNLKPYLQLELPGYAIHFKCLESQKDNNVDCGRWTEICISDIANNYKINNNYQDIIDIAEKACIAENNKNEGEKFNNCGEKFRNNTNKSKIDTVTSPNLKPRTPDNSDYYDKPNPTLFARLINFVCFWNWGKKASDATSTKIQHNAYKYFPLALTEKDPTIEEKMNENIENANKNISSNKKENIENTINNKDNLKSDNNGNDDKIVNENLQNNQQNTLQ